MDAFLFRKLFIDFQHFQVFVFCHKAYLKTWKPQKIFRSSFLDVLKLVIYFEHFTRCFVRSRCNSQSVAQSYQLAFTIIYYYLESGFSDY